MRAEKKVLRIERSEIEPQILAYMRSKSLTCVPVSVEQKPLYLRVRERQNKRQIADKTVHEAMQRLEAPSLQAVAQQLSQSATAATTPPSG